MSPENYVEAVDELVREVRLDTLRQLSALDMENAGRSWVDVAMERLL